MKKRLRIGIAWDNVVDLPDWSSGPKGAPDDVYRFIRQAGYEAVQGGDGELCGRNNLALIGIGIVPEPKDAEHFIRHWKRQGAIAITCIAGFGFEADRDMDTLIHAILTCAKTNQLPVYIETHRGSVTQDAWRTVALTERIPEIRFNLDFSHWFTGQEMAYGDFGHRLNQLGSVLARTHLLHGRIGDRCCMQVDVENGLHPSVPYFQQVWSLAIDGFLRNKEQSELWFIPELLGTKYQYARTFQAADGSLREETDRWQQAAVLSEMVRRLYAQMAAKGTF